MNTENRKKLVVVGNGMAGMRTIEELLKVAPDAYDITVFGSEPYGNYNRIMLSPVLANQQTVQDIMINDIPWYADNGITLHSDTTVASIDRDAKTVTDCKGNTTGYDMLLLSTGSNPFIIPVPGHDATGVISYRDIKDVDTMIEYAETRNNAIVIGGGLLGLEAAYGLKQRGMNVSVVHIMPTLMERQLDPVAAGMLRETLEAVGINFLMEYGTQDIVTDEEGHVTAIRFNNGEEVPTDLVVMAVGIRPNTELGKNAGLECERAIVVDDHLRTSDPSIFGVGECVQHRGIAYGLVAPLFEQAAVCAQHLAGESNSEYHGTQLMTKLKVTGVNLFSAGDFTGDDNCDFLVYEDLSQSVYKKLVIKDDTLIGAVMYGETQDGSWYFDLINSKQNVDAMRDNLIFGQAFVDAELLTA